MRERWPNERRSAAPNQRWLLRSSSVFLAMTSHTLLLESAHLGALLGLGIDGWHEAPGSPSQVGALSRFMRLISPAATKDPRIAPKALAAPTTRPCWKCQWLWMASRSGARGQLGCRLSLRPLATPLERLPGVEKGTQPGNLSVRERPGRGRAGRAAILAHELQRRLHGRHVGSVLLLGPDLLEVEHDIDELIGPRVIARLQRGVDSHRVLRPHVDQPRGEPARPHPAQRWRPGLGQAAHPDDVGTGAPDRLR